MYHVWQQTFEEQVTVVEIFVMQNVKEQHGSRTKFVLYLSV
jgi:hypothetical protein